MFCRLALDYVKNGGCVIVTRMANACRLHALQAMHTVCHTLTLSEPCVLRLRNSAHSCLEYTRPSDVFSAIEAMDSLLGWETKHHRHL